MADGQFGGLLGTCYALTLKNVERNEAEQASTKLDFIHWLDKDGKAE
jgi:hypothetical protein